MFDYATLEKVLVNYVFSAIHAGKFDELNRLGLDYEEIKLFKEISSLHHLLRHENLKLISAVSINRDHLQRTLRSARQSVYLEQAMESLLQAGACNEMMQALFGVTRQALSDRRKLLDCRVSSKKHNSLSAVCKRRVVKHVRDLWDSDRLPQGALYHQCCILLDVAQQEQMPVNDVWNAVNWAVVRGEFSWACPLKSTA